jgi:hypothetical protein
MGSVILMAVNVITFLQPNACHQRTRAPDAGIVNLHKPDKPHPRVRNLVCLTGIITPDLFIKQIP